MSAATASAGRAEPLSTSTCAGEAVRHYIGEQVEVLNRSLARSGRHEPGSVALARSAVHRIRAAIRGYRHLFTEIPHGGPQFDQLLASLKHTEDLEALRIHFADRFEQLDLTVPEYPRWFNALRAEEQHSYRQVRRLAGQVWVAALLGRLRIFADRARFTGHGDQPAATLMAVVTRGRTHMLDAYGKLSHATDLTIARDEVRQAAREARVLAEAVLPVLGREAEETLTMVSDMEHLLAQYRQAAIARNWLQRLPGTARADRLTASLNDLEREQLRQLGDQIDRAATTMIDRWQ